jgi:hypothetical protein
MVGRHGVQGAVRGGGGVEEWRERERADGGGGGTGRTAYLLAPVICHREACRAVLGTRREAVCWLLSRRRKKKEVPGSMTCGIY